MIDTKFIKLWSSLNKKSKDIENKIDAFERKRTGIYYTDMELTDTMMSELVEHLSKVNSSKKICDYRFLEPCMGSGNFVFSYIKAVAKTGISKEEAECMLNNIYVADVNIEAVNVYKESLCEIAWLLWEIELKDEYFEKHIGTGLLIDVTKNELNYIPINNVFQNDIINEGFDIVATNPPYKNLKAERSQYKSDNEYNKDKDKYSTISKIVKKNFKYSAVGVLNLYKLFVEEIIDKYANKNAFISLLIPASIMSDKTCMKLRSHILKDNKLVSVKVIEENNKYIDAQQALCTLLIKKGEKTDIVNITKDYCNKPKDIAQVKINDILNHNTGNAIISISSKEYNILKKLRKFPVVKDLPFVVNLRGELDLTTNKKYITEKDTGYPLIRGRNIGYYSLIDALKNEFVFADFINVTKKKCYIEKERIICQQIANMNKDKRVTFTLIPKNYILGNSCNFISVEDNIYGIDIYAILGLFNTKIINWLFKLTSSNNHVNNYEIDCFPIPVEAKELKQISMLTKKYLKERDEKIIEEIEKLSNIAYSIEEDTNEEMVKQDDDYIIKYCNAIKYIIPKITREDAKSILNSQMEIDDFFAGLNKFEINVASGITEKYKSLFQGKLLNHTTFKLSNLDLEMIKNVPQGGSWKNIPKEIVEKSKRLKRITQTGEELLYMDELTMKNQVIQ